jgi:streptogrisin C
MELTKFLAILAVVLPVAYGAPTEAASSLHPQILAAMKRDLGLDADQATSRVARELQATDVIEALRTSTGASFAGAWLSDDGATLSVAVTDEALAAEVSAAGATPVIVSNSLTKLQEAQLALDNIDIEQPSTFDSESAPTGIASYYVDVEANKFIIEALAASTAHAEDLAAQVGLEASEFEVRVVEEMPSTFVNVRGGDAYYINGSSRCSVGFSVTGGFVSAGHCGTAGATASTSSGTTIGRFSGSVFPGSDYAYIAGTSGNTYQGLINNYSGGTIRVTGSTQAGVGSAICRSGSTTGVFCGSVRALGATVTYSQGRVTGLTQTNVCAEPGDSGGSFYSGTQAQGVTSGGSGNCNSGGTTYFQPVNPILSRYGLTLTRS